MPLSPRTLRPANTFTPRSISGLALWLDAADSSSLYTTDAGPVTAVSSPTEISGCALWLDGADATSMFDATSGGSNVPYGNVVARWEDKSGGGRHATATGTARPTLTPSGLNGRSVVTFDGSATQMQIDSTFLVTSNATILAVARRTSGSFGAVITSKGTGDTSPALQHASGSWQINHTGNLSVIGAQAGYAVLCGTISAGATAAFANGLLQDSDASSGTLSSDATKTYIGTYRAAIANVLAGDIAEIIVYNTALSTTDRARVEAYLAAKWGISGVHAPATATSDPVGYWRDKSGNARHATQSTASYRGAVGTQGSRRAITLDGTDDHLLLGNLSAAFPTAGEVVTAYALNAVDTAYTVYQTSDNSNSDVFGALTFAGTFRNSRLAALTLSGPSAVGTHLWGVSSQSSGYNIWAEGSNVLSTTADHTGGNNHAIGMRSATPGTNQAMNGKLLEVCAFNRVLSATERVRLNRYLAARWGITLAPQVSNADAQDWINRVYANGSTVSATTAAAVNTFCDAINDAGIRDRFYRLNLFCGGAGSSDTTRLNAALVPLYRGPSLGGTQYGGTTDTNAGGASAFIAADFTESAGLTAGLSSTKYLDTGLQTSSLPAGVIDSGHLSAWHGAISAADTDPYFVAANNGSFDRAALQVSVRAASASVESCRYGKTTNVNASTGVTGARPAAFLLGQRTSAINLELWKNNSVVGTTPTSTTGIAGIPYNFYVFSANNAGTRIGDQPGTTLRHYSIGDDMTTFQVGAFYDALSAFNAAMGRV